MTGAEITDPAPPPWRAVLHGLLLLVVVGAAGSAVSLAASHAALPAQHGGAGVVGARTHPRHAASGPTTSGGPTTTTSAPAPPPGPGYVAGRVTAVGDSVMLDYQDPLRADIPGVDVEAAVSQQWSTGESVIASLKARGALGADVVVGLGTNGPITDADLDAMMTLLGGASRVLFVNVHVDRPWQDSNNAVLARGASRYPRLAVIDWASLAAQNPQWFGSDGTHLAIDGAGADALAFLVAATLASP